MGTVKYSGPVASFHCPTEATIRSLKVHFSPKQEGSGDPSPENVRPITGWDRVEVYKAGKNLFNPETVTMNMEIGSDGNPLATGSSNSWCITDFIPVKPNTTYTAKALLTKGSGRSAVYDVNKEKISTKMEALGADAETVISTGSTGCYVRLTVRIADGLNTTFEEASSATAYEPYHGSTTNYEFGVLGKNKFNWNVPVSESSPVGSDAATTREFMLDTYVIGMSVNNYYRQNYANWVLNPSVENGVISFSSGNASGYGIAFPLKLTAGQTYFLSGTGNGVVGATYYNENGELISYQNGRLNKTITVPENTVTTLIGFYANASNTDFTFSNIQLELGSTATAYEPYDPNKTVYGGWVDLISGEVCEEWRLITGNDLTSITAPTSTSSPWNHIFTIGLWNKTTGTWDKEKGASNIISDVAITSNSNANQSVFGVSNSAGMYLRDDSISTQEEFLEKYSDKHIAYEIAAPITYSLAPLEMHTFLSHNNVWSNADYVEVEYDLHETQNILARKQFIIANQPHIVKPAAAPLQNFVTDMIAPLKECKVYFSPVQEGSSDPSPDNVRPITGWTGLTAYHSGANLYIPNENNKGYIKSDGTIVVDNHSTYTDLIPVVAEDIYSFKCTTLSVNGSTNRRLHGYDSNGNWVSQLKVVTTAENTVENCNIIVTIPSGISYIRVSFRLGDTNPRVAKENVYEIDWTDSAGTVYGGYVDLVTGEVAQEWYTISIDENTTMRAYSSDARNQGTYCEASYWLSTFNAPNAAGYEPYSTDGYCNILPYIENNYSNKARANAANSVSSVCLSGVKTQEEYLAWIAEYGPVVICYRLATPIHYSLTPTQLKTLRGTNNIWSNAGDITLSYWKH